MVEIFSRTRQINRYRATATLRRPQINNTQPQNRQGAATIIYLNVLSPREHVFAENYSTGTKFKRDQSCILMTHLQSQFQIMKMFVYVRDNERKLKIIGIFSKSKGHNSAENYLSRAKFKLGSRILMIHPYSKFQLKISRYDGDNER